MAHQPPLVPFHQLTAGQYADFFALLSQRSRGLTRDGKPYYTCKFQDRRRSASVRVWSDSTWFEACQGQWQLGRLYRIRGIYGEHEKYGSQIDILEIRPITPEDRAEGFDPLDYVDQSRFNSAQMLTELRELVQSQFEDAALKRLVLVILERFAEPLQKLPATLNKFHPFAGGLLEHILSVTRSCLHLVEKYRVHYAELQPPLNRDLVLAGAILHDIGRVLEYDANAVPAGATVQGQLFGHLFLGRDLVRDVARELGDVNAELMQLLEHIIITHLIIPEWGSPRLPLIPECLIVHHADDLDAKMEMYARCLTQDQSAGPFTDRDPMLGKPLLKGRNV